MLPDGWVRQDLQEVAILERGKFSARPRNQPEYFGGDIPFVQTGDVAKANGRLTKFSQTLSPIGMSYSRTFPKRTLLFTIAANIGDVALTEFEVACPDSVVGITAKNGNSVEWLKYFLQFRKKALDGLAPQNAQKNLSLDRLRPFTVTVPPLPEQKKIAAILSTWDRAIELTEKLIATKQKRKQALMQQLLTGNVRLPGFETTTWKSCHLGDVAKNSTRRNGASTEQSIVYSVTNSVGMIPMDEGVIGESIERYKTVSRFDFAYNPMRINVGSIAMWNGDEDVLVSPDYVVFQCGPKLDAEFLEHFRKTHYWSHFVTRAGGGSVRVRIYFKDLAAMKLNLPPLEEQKAITSVLNTQNKELKLLEAKRDYLRELKKGLMQQLLTGKVRVNVEAETVKG
jgi:type I restriction enzyme S subunit